MDIFPEANVHVAAGFTKVCLTAASQCVVAQAFATQSPEMLSKLCSAVSASADEAITSFSRAGDIFKALDKNLLAYLSFVREFFSALAFYNAGKVAEKGARAVAFFGTAVGVLRQQGKAGDTVVHNPLARGLPKLVGTYSTCVSAIGTLLADLQELHETAVRENNMIYYEATLHHIDMPEPRFLAAVKKYVAMPIDGIVDFSKPVPAPTGAHASASAPVSVSVSRASSTGSTTSVGSAPAAVTLSDEEMARQLQEQFDNE